MRKILSIDWDYFFPNSEPYDWGTNEDNPVYRDVVWATRCFWLNPFTKREAIFEYLPTVPQDFWSIVTNRPKLYIADSHRDIWKLLQTFPGCSVTNLDAHHDCGYQGILRDRVDCGNWGHHGRTFIAGKLISELHLCYPRWRLTEEEPAPVTDPTTVSYLPPEPQDYDAVFLCRSSCWCPPWRDTDFKKLIESSQLHHSSLDPDFLERRRPTLTEALKIRRQHRSIVRTLLRHHPSPVPASPR